jgi:hypothetical protein
VMCVVNAKIISIFFLSVIVYAMTTELHCSDHDLVYQGVFYSLGALIFNFLLRPVPPPPLITSLFRLSTKSHLTFCSTRPTFSVSLAHLHIPPSLELR